MGAPDDDFDAIWAEKKKTLKFSRGVSGFLQILFHKLYCINIRNLSFYYHNLLVFMLVYVISVLIIPIFIY